MNENAAPAITASNELWYYADTANQPVGPLEMEVLNQLAGVGVILPETHVLKEGETEWKRYASIVPYSVGSESKTATDGITVPGAAVPAKENLPDKIKPYRLEDLFAKWKRAWDAHAKQRADKSASESSETSALKKQPFTKDGVLAGVVLGIAVIAIVLWHYLRPFFYLVCFLGTWTGVAWFSLRERKDRLLSVGGGFVMACFALASVLKLSGDGEHTDKVQANKGASLESAKKAEIIYPIFRSEAKWRLEQFSKLVEKFESLIRFFDSDHPMPKSVNGYAELVTTEDLRISAKYDLAEVTKRIAEVEQAQKAGNDCAKVVEAVSSGLNRLISAIADLEAFVNQPENRIQAARNLKSDLATIKNAVADANKRYGALSLLAPFEVIKRSEFKPWLDKGREHVERLMTAWKELDESQPQKADAEARLASLCSQGNALHAEYHTWSQAVQERKNTVPEPNQMDRLIEHSELHYKLDILFNWFTRDADYFLFIWTGKSEMNNSSKLLQYHEWRVKELAGLAKVVEEVQTEYSSPSRE